MDKYYLVSSDILPDVIEKVVEAQNLLRTGKTRRICEAVKMVGISRGTFYKYKDSIFPFEAENTSRKAIITLVIHDEKGVLSMILTRIAQLNCNVLAINQTIPINRVSNVVLTLDITDLPGNVEDLVALLKKLDHVNSASLVSVE
ncbi:ACT domain-containing protein [Erysipelotrichaceae bacterium 51-3]|uniref:ACT domain-containing protein n=1 Tax=Allobaculum sp. JKK-2023 TaxID=3108943 RepID=UPI002B057541|nr:ACT domain-containing protein [Allobaculum sp. JKK-2023]